MPILFGVGLLIALWIFIRWDQARFKKDFDKPLTRQQMMQGYAPGRNLKSVGAFGTSVICLAGAITTFTDARSPPYSGRFATIRLAIYDSFGSLGLPVFLLLLALIFACLAWHLSKAGK